MSKRLKIVFTLSVLINILLVGVVAGQAYKRHSGNGAGGWHQVKASLAPETRDVLKATFEARRPEVRAMFQESRAVRQALQDAFVAEPFDIVAFDVAVAQAMVMNEKLSQHRVEMYRGLAERLPQAEREKMARRVGSIVMGRSKHKKRSYRSK